MRITVAIPTFNRAESLADTLRSIRRLEVPDTVTCDVLIVDNNSTDHTQGIVTEVSRSFPLVLRTVVETQPGLCFGRNRALQEASGDHVVFLDDDIHVAPRWLHAYADAVQAFGADCVVGPVFPVFSGELPLHATTYVLSLIGSDYSRKGTTRFQLPPPVAHEIPGCNFGVRRDLALELGGFNTSLDRIGSELLAGGDTEFGLRLAKAGRRVVYEPECRIEHLIPHGKLERSYLRRRADGLGLTAARLRATHGPPRRYRDWYVDVKRALGLLVRWQKRKALGRSVDAFEWELRTRRHWADISAALQVRKASA